MKRVLVVLGTRPEAIKLALLIRLLRACPETFETRVCVTAQHRQMLDQTLRLFGLTPDHDLDLMRAGQSPAALTARALAALAAVIEDTAPDLVVVQGDTCTTLAGALAAFYGGVPLAHVEAGLRTRDLQAPFPEEGNRQMVTRLARLHFAPTAGNRANLLAEGVAEDGITVTGNSGIDALLWMREWLRRNPGREAAVAAELAAATGVDLRRRPFLLVTAHRRESFGAGFRAICRGLAAVAARYRDLELVYPLHLNPEVSGPAGELLSGLPNLRLIAPQDYERFVWLLDRCRLVVTDSGGIQEEAPGLGKPVLVLREVTERPEAVAAGTVRLVGSDPERLLAEVSRLLEDGEAYAAMARAQNPYGDGRACERILAVLGR